MDDVLAMLLALAAKPEEIEILMLSVTYGNVEVQRYKLPRPIDRISLIHYPAVSEMLLPSFMSLKRSWSGERLVDSSRALKPC